MAIQESVLATRETIDDVVPSGQGLAKDFFLLNVGFR